MHAFLFRNWRSRVKGRDWYDLEWYIRNGYSVDFAHLTEREIQGSNKEVQEFSKETCLEMLKKRIENANIEAVKNDVKPFLKNSDGLEIWSREYFLQLTQMVKFQ